MRDRLSSPARLAALAGLLAGVTAALPAVAQVPEYEIRDETVDEPAPTPTARPRASQRVVAVYGFEEEFTLTDGLPRGWIRAQHDLAVPRDRPGFPIYNQAAVDRTISFSGRSSIRLPTRGGSTSLRLEPGRLVVFDAADYRISAMVRTVGIERARGRLDAVLLDGDLNPIEESRSVSPLIHNAGGWTPIQLEVRGNFPEAEFMQIELQLLQPEQYRENNLGTQQIWLDDTDGAAWFDDITVTQLPRIEITTTEPTNAVTLPAAPELSVLVSDLTGEQLRARVTVTDVDGNVVDTWEQPIGAGRTMANWTPKINKLGWYRASIEVGTDEKVVGSNYCDFVWVQGRSRLSTGAARWSDPASALSVTEDAAIQSRAGTGGSLDRERFALLIEDIEGIDQDLIPDAVDRIGTGTVYVPMWAPGLDRLSVDDHIDHVLPITERLAASWQTVIGQLSEIPLLLASETRLDSHRVLEVFEREREMWQPYLLPLLDRFGQRVERWAIGELNDDWAFIDPRLNERAIAVTEIFSELVPGPALMVPWNPDEAPEADRLKSEGIGGVTLLWPAELGARAIEDFATVWGETFGEVEDSDLEYFDPLAEPPPILSTPLDDEHPEMTLVIEPETDDRFGQRERCNDVAHKALSYWAHVHAVPSPTAGHRHRVATPQPWKFSEERRSQMMPQPEFAVWRNLVERLSERAVVGELPAPEGVRAVVFAPREGAPETRTGMLAVWREDDEQSGDPLEMFLGTRPLKAVDMFGNELWLSPEPVVDALYGDNVRRLVHQIPTSRSPIFIEDVEVALARFLAGIHVEPAFLPALVREHESRLIIENPFDVTINGELVIVQPGGRPSPDSPPDRSWTISPRRARFSVGPGQKYEIPTTVSFNSAQESGGHDFVIDVSLTADREYGWMRMATPVEIGLERIAFSVNSSIIDGTDDIIVEVRVVNTGNEPTTLRAQIFAPGFPREAISITDLAPGSQGVRRFLLEDGVTKLSELYASIRLTEIATGARLNKTLTFP